MDVATYIFIYSNLSSRLSMLYFCDVKTETYSVWRTLQTRPFYPRFLGEGLAPRPSSVDPLPKTIMSGTEPHPLQLLMLLE